MISPTSNTCTYIVNTSHTQILSRIRFDELTNHDRCVYCEIRKGMYGLEEAGCVAFQNLVKNISSFGYEPMQCTIGLWYHKTRRTIFTLAVDNFGIISFNEADCDYLVNTLR